MGGVDGEESGAGGVEQDAFNTAAGIGGRGCLDEVVWGFEGVGDGEESVAFFVDEEIEGNLGDSFIDGFSYHSIGKTSDWKTGFRAG